MLVEGRDLSSRQTQYVVKDMEIGQRRSSPTLAGGQVFSAGFAEVGQEVDPALRGNVSYS
jgi:hypothetical protein